MMAKKKDLFSKKWQTSARIRGKYNAIAASVNKCVFCDLKKKYIVAENSGVVLTVNLFPYINGHLLVIPRRHVENYLELTQKEIIACQRLMKKGLKLLRDILQIDDVWLLLRDGQQGGKTVKHLHWQILPNGEKLVKWHYQKINISPESLAKTLRKQK
jgi:diadenosine tetraphosphate (Ap4A) HIT family hydrolase